MNVGELFVSLGVSGSEKTVGALSDVRKGMDTVASTSIEAKAAIIGALYALEQMSSKSGTLGTNLSNLENTINMSGESLQRWGYNAVQLGGTVDDIQGSFKGLSAAMAQLALNHPPKGFGVFLKAVGKDFDPSKTRDLEYMMGQLQIAARKLPKDIGNDMLSSFGVSLQTLADMRKRLGFTKEVRDRAPILREGEIGHLQKIKAGWTNIFTRIELMEARLNAKFGESLIQDIDKLLPSLDRLAVALGTILVKSHGLELAGKAFDGWATALGGVSDVVEGALGNQKSQARVDNAVDAYKYVIKDLIFGWRKSDQEFIEYMKNNLLRNTGGLGDLVTPKPPQRLNGDRTSSLEVNHTNHFYGPVEDTTQTAAKALNKATSGAVQQSPVQNQGG